MGSFNDTSLTGLLQFAVDHGLIVDGRIVCAGNIREWESFGTLAVRAGRAEAAGRKDAFEDEKVELQAQLDAGVLDVGQDDYVDLSRVVLDEPTPSSTVSGGEYEKVDTCFARLCKYMGESCEPHATTMGQLDEAVLTRLRGSTEVMVAFDVYSQDDPRNHVIAVVSTSRTASVVVRVAGGDGLDDCIHGVTSPQEFFNPGGRFYRHKFYAEDQPEFMLGDEGFGGDAPDVVGRRSTRTNPTQQSSTPQPRPPESVINGNAPSGGANITGGVVRPKRRAIKARGNYDVTAKTLRNYNVVGVTMFNNAEELFLNTVSREYAQEIIEDLFSVWDLPTDQASTMKYAEDLLWTFMIARTASNKADYKVALDVPTSKGDIEVSFDAFSRLLADKYGITRRNFARGVSDDLREFMRRDENQFLRSRAAQRIGADPQMGDLCFDGSTGCSGLTSAETTFTRLLESRNLYERDDVLAEGASDRLMQGVHGGVRSIVPR